MNDNRYIEEYKKKNYDRIHFFVPKGKKELLKQIAKENGVPVKTIIVNAVKNQLGVDLVAK